MTIVQMTFLLYLLAALAEIAGCFAVWAWLRNGKSALWLVPGIASLILFAFLLTRVDSAFAGRDRWDLIGAALCIAGALVIIGAPRGT